MNPTTIPVLGHAGRAGQLSVGAMVSMVRYLNRFAELRAHAHAHATDFDLLLAILDELPDAMCAISGVSAEVWRDASPQEAMRAARDYLTARFSGFDWSAQIIEINDELARLAKDVQMAVDALAPMRPE